MCLQDVTPGLHNALREKLTDRPLMFYSQKHASCGFGTLAIRPPRAGAAEMPTRAGAPVATVNLFDVASQKLVLGVCHTRRWPEGDRACREGTGSQ